MEPENIICSFVARRLQKWTERRTLCPRAARQQLSRNCTTSFLSFSTTGKTTVNGCLNLELWFQIPSRDALLSNSTDDPSKERIWAG